MIRHMRDTVGKEPVWGAVEFNAPSMRLAAKLGFVPVDRVFVFEPVRDR
jgi:RimJ/RimL family protein N-acetyltransferase